MMAFQGAGQGSKQRFLQQSIQSLIGIAVLTSAGLPSSAAPAPTPITQSPPASPAPIQAPPPARPAAPAPFPSPTTPTTPATPITPTPPTTPAAPAAPPAATPPAAVPARAPIPLVEQTSYINACRKTNRSTEVFSDVALSPVNRIGTLNPDTPVALTGVLAQGRAQILLRSAPNAIVLVGWVEAANLTTCDVVLQPTQPAQPAQPAQPSQPADPSQPASGRVCYRIESDGALAVRAAASVTAEARGSLPRGTIVYATTNPPREQTAAPTPPELGRQWVEITYQGGPAWIASTGPNGIGTNVTRLSEGECAS